MAFKAKHIVEEIEGTRCTIVEKGATAERVDFLKSLLELNNFGVRLAEETPIEGSPTLFTIGVTDLVFNPVIAVFERSLKTPLGDKVSAIYWNQYSTESIGEYWEFVK
jgi:hypothetical protein